MRTWIRRSLFIIMAAVLTGCGSGMGAKSTPASAAQGAMPTTLMKSGGVNVLRLTVPPDIKCVAADGSLHFTAPQYEVEFWVVPGAKTVADAMGNVPMQIVSEFKDFKPEHTTEFIVAGSPAKEMVGAGHEADDNDPGDADVIVFKVGDHIFVACNHGESLTPAGQQGLMSLVQTAQMP